MEEILAGWPTLRPASLHMRRSSRAALPASSRTPLRIFSFSGRRCIDDGVASRLSSFERSSFEEVQPIPPASGGIVWHHAGNHYNHPRHRHAALELNLVVRGRGHYEVGGRCHPLSAGTALFIAPSIDHHLEERTPDFEMWILALGPALLEQ